MLLSLVVEYYAGHRSATIQEVGVPGGPAVTGGLMK